MQKYHSSVGRITFIHIFCQTSNKKFDKDQKVSQYKHITLKDIKWINISNIIGLWAHKSTQLLWEPGPTSCNNLLNYPRKSTYSLVLGLLHSTAEHCALVLLNSRHVQELSSLIEPREQVGGTPIATHFLKDGKRPFTLLSPFSWT